MAAEILIVDGYNIIFAWPESKRNFIDVSSLDIVKNETGRYIKQLSAIRRTR